MADPALVSELLSKTIADAHWRTCLRSTEEIQETFLLGRRSRDLLSVAHYRNMTREQLWLETSQKLNTFMKGIIEFAKMVPGFMRLTQDDQIVLLKTGLFELVMLRMSRYLNLEHDCVLYGDVMLPYDVFCSSDEAEATLISAVFDMAKSIAELKLTETELGLYSAAVLLNPDRHGLRGDDQILRLWQAVRIALSSELEKNEAPPTKCDEMMAKIGRLTEISTLHSDALDKFKRLQPQLAFPHLHAEVFRLL